MKAKLTERVVVEREITGIVRDLVMFVHYLRENSHGCALEGLKDDELVRAARNYWDREHVE